MHSAGFRARPVSLYYVKVGALGAPLENPQSIDNSSFSLSNAPIAPIKIIMIK